MKFWSCIVLKQSTLTKKQSHLVPSPSSQRMKSEEFQLVWSTESKDNSTLQIELWCPLDWLKLDPWLPERSKRFMSRTSLKSCRTQWTVTFISPNSTIWIHSPFSRLLKWIWCFLWRRGFLHKHICTDWGDISWLHFQWHSHLNSTNLPSHRNHNGYLSMITMDPVEETIWQSFSLTR